MQKIILVLCIMFSYKIHMAANNDSLFKPKLLFDISMTPQMSKVENCDSSKIQLVIGAGMNHHYPFKDRYIEPGDPSSTTHSVELDGFTEKRVLSYHGYCNIKYSFNNCKYPFLRSYFLVGGIAFFNRKTIYSSDSTSVAMYQLPYLPSKDIIEYKESISTVELPLFIGIKKENFLIEAGVFAALPIQTFFKVKTTHVNQSETYYLGRTASYYIHSYRSSISLSIKCQYQISMFSLNPSVYLALNVRNFYNNQEILGGIEIPIFNKN